jgi:hypothetical protein
VEGSLRLATDHRPGFLKSSSVEALNVDKSSVARRIDNIRGVMLARKKATVAGGMVKRMVMWMWM